MLKPLLKKFSQNQFFSLFGAIFLIVVLLFYPLNSNNLNSQALTYNQQKQEVENQKSKINDSLDEISTNLEDAQQLGITLKDEIDQKDQEIQKTQSAVEEVNKLIATLETQINENQKLRDETVETIKSLFIEMQKQQSPFQTLLSSENLADALTKFYSASLLQAKADDYRVKLDETTQRLEQGKQDQLEAKTKLEQTQSLLASQQSYLIDLRTKTQNDENKYQQLKSSLIEQNKQLESKLAALEQQRQKEEAEARRQAEEEARKRAASGNGSSGSQSGSNSGSGGSYSSGGCSFEEKRSLSVPSGYFGRPTRGFLVRAFAGCTHDATDIANGTNTELYAVAPGTVVRKGSFDVVGYGIYVVIKHVLPSGQTVYTLYAHMNSSSPRQVGENVTRGEVVGFMGCTGECFGTHVHFMMYSDSYESNGPGCRLGSSKCYDPTKYIDI